MRQFKNPRGGMALTAAAGPACNVVITAVCLFLYGLLVPLLGDRGWGNYVVITVYRTAYLSLSLAVFNILPIPPLDGSKVLYSVIPERSYWNLMRYERYGMLILLVLVVTGVLSGPLSKAVSFLFEKLFFLADAGFGLGIKIIY